MTNLNDAYISDLCLQVKRLQDEFMKICNVDERRAAECLKKMRVCHADAMGYTNGALKSSLGSAAPEDSKVQLSIFASAVDVIHNCIKKCEKKLYNPGAMFDTTEFLPQTKKTSHHSPSKKIYAVIRDDDMISVKGIETDMSAPNQPLKQIRKSSNPSLTESMNTDGLCAFLDSMAENTTEAKKVFGLSSQSQRGGGGSCGVSMAGGSDSKMYVVNLWSSSCSHSLDFLKAWSEFIESLRSKGSMTECHSLCYTDGNDEQLSRIMSKASITGFPTVLFFCGDKVHKQVGKTSSQKLMEIHDSISK